jgi:hypothetical protein
MEKRVIILSSQEDYWEACYLDGKSIDQMHHLGEGHGKISYIKDLCKTHGLTLDDIGEADAEAVDDEKAQECGCFPDLFEDLEGDYSLDLS